MSIEDVLEIIRSPQTRHKRGKRIHYLYSQFQTVRPSIRKLDTGLDRIQTQDTRSICRRIKKRSDWIGQLSDYYRGSQHTH